MDHNFNYLFNNKEEKEDFKKEREDIRNYLLTLYSGTLIKIDNNTNNQKEIGKIINKNDEEINEFIKNENNLNLEDEKKYFNNNYNKHNILTNQKSTSTQDSYVRNINRKNKKANTDVKNSMILESELKDAQKNQKEIQNKLEFIKDEITLIKKNLNPIKKIPKKVISIDNSQNENAINFVKRIKKNKKELTIKLLKNKEITENKINLLNKKKELEKIENFERERNQRRENALQRMKIRNKERPTSENTYNSKKVIN